MPVSNKVIYFSLSLSCMIQFAAGIILVFYSFFSYNHQLLPFTFTTIYLFTNN